MDVELLLQGDVRPRTYAQLCAISPLTGSEVPVTPEERELLERDAIDESALAGAERERVARLAAAGLLVAEDDERERALADGRWNVYSALAHAMWRWRGVDAATRADELTADAFVERFGEAPPHFAAHGEGAHVTELPLVAPDERIATLLLARRTTREFDHTSPLPRSTLALLLRWVWGAHGYAHVTEQTVTLRKTSPSGGGLHPVEVYPLVLRVEGLEPGLYRYRPDDHALELREALGLDEGRELASLFCARQAYFAEADVLFLMTARFARQTWKYQRHPRAYGVLLMDAAHLSQTFYLLCAELGLGAFVTAAINGADVDERLGLEPFVESALAICGCGTPSREPAGLDPVFEPYVPRETEI